MTTLKYAVCAILLVSSVVMADHKKHRKHATKDMTVSQRFEVTEPAPVIVGEPVVVDDDAVAADLAHAGLATRNPCECISSSRANHRAEVEQTVVHTESRLGNCDRCRPCKVKCGKAKIEELKGKACCTPEGLSGRIRYEVETERVCPGQLELVMQFSHCGRLLADEQGQPIALVVQLDNPSDTDDDECEYKGSIQVPLPNGPWGDELRIQGQVVSRASSAVLARDRGELELPDDDD